MDYISQSPTHCSKGNIGCVLQCTKFPDKKPMFISPIQTAHQLNNNTWNLEMVFKKKGKNNHTCPMFDNYFLASSKQINCEPLIIFFQSNRTTYVIKIHCVLCIVDWCLTNHYEYIYREHKKINRITSEAFFPESRMIQFTCTKYL